MAKRQAETWALVERSDEHEKTRTRKARKWEENARHTLTYGEDGNDLKDND